MPRLYAHRGAAAEQPEKTLPSFRRALDLGADALEMDAHLTSDGIVVVSHDPDGNRMAGVDREIRRSQLSEVQSWDVGRGFVGKGGGRPFSGYRIPTLEEVLVEFPGVVLNVDVKQEAPDMVLAMLALLRKLRAQERVILASFSNRTIARLRQLGYEGPTSLGPAQMIELLLVPRPLLGLLPRRGQAVQIPPRERGIPLATRWLIEKCHRLGLRVDYWTINDPVIARALLAIGADGIMTDDPALIAPVFRERATSP